MNTRYKCLIFGVLLVSVSLDVYILWCYSHIFNGEFSQNTEEFSRFGDYVGGTIGVVMGLVSVFLLYLTCKQQVEYSFDQAKQGRKVQFETNLFQLLAVQRDIKNVLAVNYRNPMKTDEQKTSVGYEAISKAAEDLKCSMLDFSYQQSSISQMSQSDLRTKINSIFCQSLGNNQGYALSHYYRHFYNIVKYIDTSENDDEAKRQYVSIVQSELSNDELYLLFFDALSKYGYPKFYNMIEKYRILENLYYDEFDYFKILQRKCYPNTYFKHSPNNVVIVAGYFSKLRESTLLSISQKYGIVIADVEQINYNAHPPFRIHIGGTVQVVDNLSDALSDDRQYIFDTSFITNIGNYDFKTIREDVFRTLNPKAVVVCVDEEDDIYTCQSTHHSTWFSKTMIEQALEAEKRSAKLFCESYNLPLLICKSTDEGKMVELLLG